MRLFFDVQCLQTASGTRGIGRYTHGLLLGLAAEADRRGWSVSAVLNERLASPRFDRWPSNVHRLGYCSARPQPSLISEPDASEVAEANDRAFADWLLAARPDVLLCGSIFETHTLLPRFSVGATRPAVVAVVYDLIPLLFPHVYLPVAEWRNWYADRLRWLLAADRLLAISQATADDVNRITGYPAEQVTPIAGAPAEELQPLPSAELAERMARLRLRHGISGDYILYVGGGDHRKNLGGAVRALAALPQAIHVARNVPATEERVGDGCPEQPCLVIACDLPEPLPRDLALLAERVGVGNRLRLTGFVEDADLAALMQGCRVFFFPSLYEGLGLPVVEALRCGAPVVVSSTGSLPEFAGPTAWTAPPDDPQALAAALAAALAEPREQRREVRLAWAERFTWSATGRAAAEVLAKLVAGVCVPPEESACTPTRLHVGTSDQLHPIFGEPIRPDVELARVLARRFRAGPNRFRRVPWSPPNDATLASLAELNVEATAQARPTAWLVRKLRSLVQILIRPWLARQSDYNRAVLLELRRLARNSAQHETTLEHWESHISRDDDRPEQGASP